MLGDWLAFGQRCYGRRYKDAVEATGLDYQTLRNYAAVARRFPLSRRRDNLSFQHHAELCALPEAAQDRWLDLAAENHWSKRELRLRVRAARSVDDARSELHVLRVAVERGHAQSWREAAERCHCRYGDWVVNALNAAAAGSVTSSVER